MLRVRTVTTTSGATAVQIVKYENGKRIIIAHIGSAHIPEKLEALHREARRWIEKNSGQKSLFPQVLNAALIEKTRLLLGIKGYYTNLSGETDKTIVDHYHSLWHVEQVFRIAKSDLCYASYLSLQKTNH